jgi:hypothetical protein
MGRKRRPRKSNAGREREPAGDRPGVPDSDYLLDAAEANWPHILRMYRLFEDRRPVMLYDLQERRVYAYPYPEFKEEMSERSQRSLEEQYEKAGREGKVVVFVRDNDQRRLVAFSMALE